VSDHADETPMRGSEVTVSASDVVGIAVWFALLSGFLEVARLAVARYALGAYVHRSLQVVWLAPMSHLLFFAVPALALLAFILFRRNGLALKVPMFVFSLLASLALLLGVPRLSGIAIALIAVGMATQLARIASRHAERSLRLVRATSYVLLVILALTIAASLTAAWWAERRALNGLPPVANQGAPNVLLLVMDTVRAQNMSIYGYHRETTPELERLAERGVVFEQAISTAPWTLPSHAAMFTGRYHHELSVGWVRALDDTYPTLAEVLAARGYVTGGFVANTLYCGEQSGLSRGFVHYDDFSTTSLGELIQSSTLGRDFSLLEWPEPIRNFRFEVTGKRAWKVNHDFLEWVDQAGDRPFFAFLNYMDAHEPYLPPEPFTRLFSDKRPRSAFVEDEDRYTPEELADLMAAYDGGIAYVDHEIGRVLEDLERRGKLANTIVVVTSDHGEEFGEHGYVSHSNSLHIQGIHVPLIVVVPGGEASGTRIPRRFWVSSAAKRRKPFLGTPSRGIGAVTRGRACRRFSRKSIEPRTSPIGSPSPAATSSRSSRTTTISFETATGASICTISGETRTRRPITPRPATSVAS
jgi:hypothetical protein